MPYATQKMVKYMKEKGMSSSSGGESTDSSIISSAEEKKKIRDLPSSVDPADDDDSSPKRSSSGSSLRKKSSTKKAKSKKAKSKKKSKSKSRRGSSSSRKKSLVKPSSSGLKKKSSKSSSKRKFKMVANAELALAPLQEMGGVPGTANYDELTFDEKKVLFLKTLLTANIGKLKRTPATEPPEEGEQSFRLYSIDEEKPLWTGKPHSAKALYVATHQSFPPEIQVVCKQYDAKLYNPKSSLFLKVLRHLGKEHPSIIQVNKRKACMFKFIFNHNFLDLERRQQGRPGVRLPGDRPLRDTGRSGEKEEGPTGGERLPAGRLSAAFRHGLFRRHGHFPSSYRPSPPADSTPGDAAARQADRLPLGGHLLQ